MLAIGAEKLSEKRFFDKSMAALIMSMAWPTILELALQKVVQFIDSAMVGRISASAAAAVGLTQTVVWLIDGLFTAAGVGFLAVIARAIGAEDYEKAGKTSGQSVWVALIMGLMVGAIALSISFPLPGWMGADEAVRRDAGIYFFTINVPMVFRSAIILFGAVLRATGDMRHPMLVNMAMNIINVVLNFFLIYPTRQITLLGWEFTIWGAGLEVAGAAIATASAYTVGGILMFLILCRSDKGVAPTRESIRPDKEILKRVAQIGIPNAAERTVVCLGSTVFVSMVASLGTISLAAHSIAITAEGGFYVPGYGFMSTAATLAGMILGEGNEEKLERMTKTLMSINVLFMLFASTLMFVFPEMLISIFTKDPQVIEKGVLVMRIVAISEPFFGISLSLEGVFNGVGDTRYPFFISLGTMWGIRILFTFLCVKVLGLGLGAVWMCMVADVISRSVFMYLRYRSGRWKKGNFEAQPQVQ